MKKSQAHAGRGEKSSSFQGRGEGLCGLRQALKIGIPNPPRTRPNWMKPLMGSQVSAEQRIRNHPNQRNRLRVGRAELEWGKKTSHE
jgi:hypothetical protein